MSLRRHYQAKMVAANQFLRTHFLPSYTQRFAVSAAEASTVFIS
ncbi:MAG: hypothetical protein ACT4PN_00075 [Nitrospiraceae bacterium]